MQNEMNQVSAWASTLLLLVLRSSFILEVSADFNVSGMRGLFNLAMK